MARKGLWISPNEFRNFAAVDQTRSLSDEIATRQRSIDFYSLSMYLPNPDPVLKKMGKDITVYKELLSDAHVQGCVTSRKSGVKKLLWEIDRGKSKSRQAKFIESVFKNLPVDRIIGQILNAPLYGYQALEVIWDSNFMPTDVVAKPPQWFVFDDANRLRFRTKANYINGEELPEKKFIVATNNADYENPYGFPVLSCCFWPVTFRKGGYKFWVTFTEKFGMPFIVGKVPRGTDQTEKDKLADTLENMVQDAIAVIPDDASVEIPEQKTSASADIYSKLIEANKAEISIALLGHTGSSQSTPGKLGGEDQAQQVRSDIVGDDKKIVEDAMNTLIDWTCEFNFAERSERPRFILYEEEDVDLDQATRDKTLADTNQIRFTKNYFMTAYGFEDGDIEVVQPPAVNPFSPGARGPVPPAQFSKGIPADQKAIDDAIANLDPAELQKQAEAVLKPVIDLIKSGDSYEQVMTNLTKAYPGMSSVELEKMLERAIFVCEAWGRMSVQSG